MKRCLSRTLKDLSSHGLLHGITVVTIALTILVAGSLLLVVENGEALISSWKSGVRVMVYLKGGTPSEAIEEVGRSIESMTGVDKAIYISRDEALTDLMESMEGQQSLFAGLSTNPLPDSFEVAFEADSLEWKEVKNLAEAMAHLPSVDEVEYGRSWLARISRILSMVELAGVALAGLFFIIALFIVYNTVRLALYSRREEIEIMQLMGATQGFIKAPLYLAGVFEGALGATIALGTLFVLFSLLAPEGLGEHGFQLSFLSLKAVGVTLVYAIFVGWFGCFLSLREFMKDASL